MDELAKHLGIGFGIGVGADYIVEKFGSNMGSPLYFLNTFPNPNASPFEQQSLIQKLLYGGGGVLAVLGLIGGKDTYEYIPIGLSMVVGTYLYERYLAILLGVRKLN
jgi:hypothetical protein